MPVKRSKAKRRRPHLEEADFAAFLAGDGLALHRALDLKPWEFGWPTILTEAEEGQWAVEGLMQQREYIEAELLRGRWEWPRHEVS